MKNPGTIIDYLDLYEVHLDIKWQKYYTEHKPSTFKGRGPNANLSSTPWFNAVLTGYVLDGKGTEKPFYLRVGKTVVGKADHCTYQTGINAPLPDDVRRSKFMRLVFNLYEVPMIDRNGNFIWPAQASTLPVREAAIKKYEEHMDTIVNSYMDEMSSPDEDSGSAANFPPKNTPLPKVTRDKINHRPPKDERYEAIAKIQRKRDEEAREAKEREAEKKRIEEELRVRNEQMENLKNILGMDDVDPEEDDVFTVEIDIDD